MSVVVQKKPDLRDKIESSAGTSIAALRHYARGHNTDIYLADMEDGDRLIIKIAKDQTARLDIEGWMLEYLRDNSDLPVPRVLAAERGFLLMTWLADGGPMDGRTQTHAAELIVALHGIGSIKYGLERDTVIGPFMQPNGRTESWVDFFRENRLLHMTRQARDRAAIDGALAGKLEKMSKRLEDLIGTPAVPGLVHGDLWSGNVLASGGRITGFVDPAIYYADPEVDLAFICLFNTFGDEFFRRYQEKRPIREGFFEVRKDVYNLYPLLIHACLFGGSYGEAVEKIVGRFV